MQLQLAPKKEPGLPPILAGRSTPVMRGRVRQFYFSVASLFEAWVTRRQSRHTQRAYRADVMSSVRFLGTPWPEGAIALYSVSVKTCSPSASSL